MTFQGCCPWSLQWYELLLLVLNADFVSLSKEKARKRRLIKGRCRRNPVGDVREAWRAQCGAAELHPNLEEPNESGPRTEEGEKPPRSSRGYSCTVRRLQAAVISATPLDAGQTRVFIIRCARCE